MTRYENEFSQMAESELSMEVKELTEQLNIANETIKQLSERILMLTVDVDVFEDMIQQSDDIGSIVKGYN